MKPTAARTRCRTVFQPLVLAALISLGLPARAAELVVYSTGAVRSVVSALAEVFRQETGHTVRLSSATAGEVQAQMEQGAPADLVIAPDATISRLAAKGLAIGEARHVIARVGMGVAVREGAPRPAIDTPEAFRQTLLDAATLTYSDPAAGGTSGQALMGLVDRLGIGAAVRAKATPGTGYVCEKVARGEVALCVHQISEILPVAGVVLVGPLPPALQQVTAYVAAPTPRGADAPLAQAFIELLTRPAMRARFAAAGMDYPAP
ncbi:molybdate ABC transporter substrate-binding protein [Aquabacterium sp.]|uniref:molybdate ABC transporter substrate-binding protein n=1 Tax=Aquabacterium sp. TaxID=1872578 RepID=UPI002C8A25E4|nr:substrate-binding domain-containing protein [Aquabacterium sp.]HSW07742.1 substrate-binding domain-containing protein [Aquabacterium sp.]